MKETTTQTEPQLELQKECHGVEMADRGELDLDPRAKLKRNDHLSTSI